jgi:magnesium chelatase subunit D
LPSVEVPDPVLAALCTRCAREGADGLRADLTIYKAASALAAYEGRTTVTLEDIEVVAELALMHRRTHHGPAPTPPSPPPSGSGDDRSAPDRPEILPRQEYYASRDRRDEPVASAAPNETQQTSLGEGDEPQVIPAAEPRSAPQWTPRVAAAKRRPGKAGRRGGLTTTDRRGVFVRATVPNGRARDPALSATLRAAAPWQAARGRAHGDPLILRARDLRDKVRARLAQHLILFVVDASRSMGARKRMAQTKGAVLSLLVDAYQKRDRVGLITFGGRSARLALPPTRSVRVAARHLTELLVGGLTPLAHGLALAGRIVANARRREPGVVPLVVLLTDGRGNVALRPGGHPEADALGLARRLAQGGVGGLVIDTETGPVRLGLARTIANAWGVELKPLDHLGGRRLPEAVRRALLAG